jgi:protein-tyrosine phosphatase
MQVAPDSDIDAVRRTMRRSGMSSNSRFHIMYVCTANICRSPMAERVAGQRLRQVLGPAAARFTVSSAGTSALQGDDIHPYAVKALESLGAPVDGFRARQVTAGLLADADLVLTAGREHRAACVSLEPTTLGRCFTIRQFARLAETVSGSSLPIGDPVTRARHLVAAALRARGTLQPVAPEFDGVPDPIGRSPEVFADCAQLLREAVGLPLDLIAGG